MSGIKHQPLTTSKVAAVKQFFKKINLIKKTSGKVEPMIDGEG
jgi:hypothetical protein